MAPAVAGADGAARSRWARRASICRVRAGVKAPTLVVTGEPGLDRRRAGRVTRALPATSCDRREHVVLERTGHIGSVTRPDAVCRAVARKRSWMTTRHSCVRSRARPARSKRCSTCRTASRARWPCSAIRIRCTAARCTPRRCIRRPRRCRASAARCCASTSAASAAAPARSTTGPARRTTFAPRSTSSASAIPALPLWAAGMSFGSWIALTVGADDPRVSLLLGIAPPVDRYDFDALQDLHAAEVHRPRRARRVDLDQGRSASSTRSSRSRRSWSTIEDANHLFDGKTSLVGDAIEDLLADFDTSLAQTPS